jgi:hypothetical protein
VVAIEGSNVQSIRWKYYIFSVGSEVVAVHAMKEYRDRRGIAPLILNLGARWSSVVNFTLRPLYLLGNESGVYGMGPRSLLDGLGREKTLFSR